MPNQKIESNKGCLVALFPWLEKKTTPDIVITDDQEPLPYRLRDNFLSHAEFSFYKVLAGILGEKYIILCKVRLADIFYVSQPNINLRFFNYISSKHVDFLVCETELMKPVFAVELDDSSHNREDRVERDEFVDQVYSIADFPLLHFQAKYAYNKAEVLNLLNTILQKESDTKKELSTQPSSPFIEPNNVVPICPNCGIPMVLRTVEQGKFAGRQYYGCENYPKCKEMKKAD